MHKHHLPAAFLELALAFFFFTPPAARSMLSSCVQRAAACFSTAVEAQALRCRQPNGKFLRFRIRVAAPSMQRLQACSVDTSRGSTKLKHGAVTRRSYA
jgi:hypothetical protein